MTKFKNQSVLAGVALALSAFLVSPAFATIPGSAVTTAQLPVYGIYTTSDATCQTGLVAGIPLSKTPQTFDFTKSPVIGNGGVASPINCVVIVAQAAFTGVLASGNYTGTTGGNNDSLCNAGCYTRADGRCNTAAPAAALPVCQNAATESWPVQVQTDAATVGLTLPTSCTHSITDIIPIYISSDSSSTQGASTMFNFPTGPNDAAHGIHLGGAPITPGTSLTFVNDPTGMFGGNFGGCNNIGPPLWSFRN